MRLWSIQEEPYWLETKARGYFDPDVSHPDAFGGDWMHAYDWMHTQMRWRIPDFTGRWPVWAWTERPNLRSEHRPPSGNIVVLLELEVPDHKVLLSDFHDWHCVLNRGYHPSDEEEEDETFYDDGGGYDQKNALEVVKSWDRVFDLKPGDRLQACVDDVRIEHVRSMVRFKGRQWKVKP
jgi:Domain of unknown function (DUF3841)